MVGNTWEETPAPFNIPGIFSENSVTLDANAPGGYSGAVNLINTTAYYGQTENDVNFANYTDINIEGGKGVNNKYFKTGKDMGFESFNGLFFTSNKTLISQNSPHINTTYELQIGFFKIQHTITNTIGSKESDWTFKIGSSTNLKIAGGVKVGTSYRLTEYVNE